MRKFDLSLRSSRSSYFATFRHQLTILSKTDALDEEKWLNMLGTFVKDRKSGSAGMPRPISYAVFCLKKKNIDKFSFVIAFISSMLLASQANSLLPKSHNYSDF